MYAEQEYGTDMKKCVYIEGITAKTTDDQITEFCMQFGSVDKVLRVRQTGQGTGVKALVEFESEETAIKLASTLPLYLPSVSNPDIMWRVDGACKTAQSSKTMSPTLCPRQQSDSSGSENEPDSDNSWTPLLRRQTAKNKEIEEVVAETASKVKGQRTVSKPTHPVSQLTLDSDVYNPPEVQKIIVEHVIKSDAPPTPSQGSKGLRPFSGRVPKPQNEVDFETWSLHVELMIQDNLPLDVQRRKILESLLSPASDLVRQLGPHAAPREYVKLLGSAYGLVEDGEEIFARFLNTHQNTGEKASEYLQRLQVLLTTAAQRGGVRSSETGKHLLRQFRRGCWDQSLILALQSELNSDTATDFSDFLLQLRTEEDRRAAKFDRMNRHLGGVKAKSSVHMQLVPDMSSMHDENTSVLQTYITETEDLRRQVTELKMQLNKKKEQRKQKHAEKRNPTLNASASITPVAVQAQQMAPKPRPKPWFCFKCGNDGHIARECEGPPNKILVDQKYKELRERQREWEAKYGHLNWTGSQWRD